MSITTGEVSWDGAGERQQWGGPCVDTAAGDGEQRPARGASLKQHVFWRVVLGRHCAKHWTLSPRASPVCLGVCNSFFLEKEEVEALREVCEHF